MGILGKAFIEPQSATLPISKISSANKANLPTLQRMILRNALHFASIPQRRGRDQRLTKWEEKLTKGAILELEKSLTSLTSGGMQGLAQHLTEAHFSEQPEKKSALAGNRP